LLQKRFCNIIRQDEGKQAHLAEAISDGMPSGLEGWIR
jgi:hypothetical protein